MKELKQVTKEEFNTFINSYKSEITPHCWNEVTLYFDFNMPSNHQIGSAERLDDSLIAKIVEPFWNAPNEYYILNS